MRDDTKVPFKSNLKTQIVKNLWLPLGLEAPAMRPNSVILLLTVKSHAEGRHEMQVMIVTAVHVWVQEHVKEMLGLRHGTGPIPGTPVPQGAEAGKLEASIQNLHK